MKKTTLLLFTLLLAEISFGQNYVALGQVKGKISNIEACEAGGKGVISYPKDWYLGTNVTPDAIYAGESADANWKWDQIATESDQVYFNGEAQLRNAYSTSDTDITAMISINNTTDFTLKAYNKRAAGSSTLLSCVGGTTGNKVLRFSLQLTNPINSGDVRTVTITITDTNGTQENILLTVTGSDLLSTKTINNSNFNYGPNPVSDVVNISAANIIETVTIYDFSGQRLFQQEINAKKSVVDIANLVPGIYFMRVRIDGEEESFKLVKK